MPRPKMSEEKKRKKQLSIYLNETEDRDFQLLVECESGRDRAKCGLEAIRLWMDMQKNPPETVTRSRIERLRQEKNMLTKGYVCGRGHSFWIQWTWPMAPKECPCCGDSHIERSWSGTISKGDKE